MGQYDYKTEHFDKEWFLSGFSVHFRKRKITQGGGYTRARAIYPDPLGTCEDCQENPATDRHHVDNDRTNNHRSNVQFLCTPCHRKTYGPQKGV